MNFEFNQDLTLENERLILSPLGINHLDELLQISIDHPDLLQYSPSPFGSKEKLQEYIEEAISEREKEIRYPFVIYDKQSRSYAGSTSFANVSNHHQRLEIGWTWLGPKFQGTGLNKNCKFLLLQYVFETLGFERLEFKTDALNLRSRAALLSIGAKEEGEHRSDTLMIDGRRRNTVYFSILKAEWPEIKNRIFANYKT